MSEHFKDWLLLKWSKYSKLGTEYILLQNNLKQALEALDAEKIPMESKTIDARTCKVKYNIMRDIVIRNDRNMLLILHKIERKPLVNYIPDYNKRSNSNNPMTAALEVFKKVVNACSDPFSCSMLETELCVQTYTDSVPGLVNLINKSDQIIFAAKSYVEELIVCRFEIFHDNVLEQALVEIKA